MLELEDVKTHLRVEHTDEDDYIQSLLDAAIVQIENDTQCRLNKVHLNLKLPCFTQEIELPVCPVESVDVITYKDINGTQQTLSDWYLDNSKLKAVVKPLYGQVFPSVQSGYDSVQITYTVGSAVLPKPVNQAALLLIGHWYSNREAVVTGITTAELPMAYKALIQPYVVPF